MVNVERASNVLTGRAAESGVLPATRTATHAELRRLGIPAVDPAVWSTTAYRADRQLWVRGRSLTSADDVWVPAGAAFLQHRPPPGCTATVRTGSTGVAAHPRREADTAQAAREILERELIRRSWCAPEHHRPSAYDITAEPTGLPAGLRALLVREQLRATALLPPAPQQMCVAVVCLHTEDGRLRSKPGGRDIPVTIGDFAAPPADEESGAYALVYAANATFGELTTQAAQLACFANAARRLRPGGFFVLDAHLPEALATVSAGTQPVNNTGQDFVLRTRSIHPARQHYVSDYVVLDDDRLRHVRVTFRYASAGELDLMAAAAGLRLRLRTGGWSGTPFKDSSSCHVSVYELPA